MSPAHSVANKMANEVTVSMLSLLLVVILPTLALQPKHPVILVPGDGGSQLFAKLNRSEVPHFYCESKSSDYFNIWLNILEIAPGSLNCFVDNMRLRYNRTTHTSHNAEGVDIRIDRFGDTDTVEWLDPDYYAHYSALAYYFYIVKTLVTQLNYTRNKNIRGAPYDFRRAPNELGEFYKNLTRLIEDTYRENNNMPVVMVAHSMGNPVMLYFYNHMDKAWKDKYIRAHISLSGVWAGAVKPVRLMTSGDSLGIYVVEAKRVRPEQRAMPSTAWLMPSTRFWSEEEVLVITDKRNYTSRDYKQLFNDINYEDGYFLWQDTQKLIYDLVAPEVELHCLYGSGINTPGTLKFAPGGFPDKYPDNIPDNGDGTVNMRSLQAFMPWMKAQSKPITYQVLDKAEHTDILSDIRTLNYIVKFMSTLS